MEEAENLGGGRSCNRAEQLRKDMGIAVRSDEVSCLLVLYCTVLWSVQFCYTVVRSVELSRATGQSVSLCVHICKRLLMRSGMLSALAFAYQIQTRLCSIFAFDWVRLIILRME